MPNDRRVAKWYERRWSSVTAAQVGALGRQVKHWARNVTLHHQIFESIHVPYCAILENLGEERKRTYIGSAERTVGTLEQLRWAPWDRDCRGSVHLESGSCKIPQAREALHTIMTVVS